MSTGGEKYLYDVISTTVGIEDLAKRVSERLQKGWRCVGGVSTATIVHSEGATMILSQAVVRADYASSI